MQTVFAGSVSAAWSGSWLSEIKKSKYNKWLFQLSSFGETSGQGQEDLGSVNDDNSIVWSAAWLDNDQGYSERLDKANVYV